jgi:phosphoserine aminotransferase
MLNISDNRYSSGPCKKRPGWNVNVLENALVGRSHKSIECVNRIKEVNKLQRELLKIPENFKMGILIGSDTAAVEGAIWTLIGERDIDCIVTDAFSKKWYKDLTEVLKLKNVRKLDDENGVDNDKDIIFCLNGTTSGKYIGGLDFIKDNRKGLTICDATSGVFAYNIDWKKIDILCYSWQKVLGSEAAHGVVVVSPRVFERMQNYKPDRPIPELINLRNEKLFEDGQTINTLSMLCIEDLKDALTWAINNDIIKKIDENSNFMYDFIDKSDILKARVTDKKYRSKTSITFTIDKTEIIPEVVEIMANKKIAFDIKGYRTELPGFRVWAGPTVNLSDLKIMMIELEKTIKELL